MSFDWQDFVSLSREMIESGGNDPDQAICRTSIGRAYYGVFCECRDRKGMSDIRGKVHTRVKDRYMSSSIREENQIGAKLSRLSEYRIQSDYVANNEIKKELAERAIIEATSIISLLRGLSP